ncbi:MAG: aldehyde dehydrogenase family protein [Tepidamorphaceae bacterium]
MLAGLFNVVQGAGLVGAALSSDPGIAKVPVTGSVPTGMRAMRAASDTLEERDTGTWRQVAADCLLRCRHRQRAVSGAMLGNFYSSGQICSNGTRVFVHRPIMEAFLRALAERTAKIVLGDPMDEATQLGPIITKAQYERVLDYMEIGKAEGARLVTGGGTARVDALPDGLFVQPTVFADVTDEMTIAREEIFGPVMSVLSFNDEDEVVARANGTEFGLAASVFTRDISPRLHRVAANLRAYTCRINTRQFDAGGSAFWWHETLRHRPRERPRGHRPLFRTQDGLC